MHTILVVDGERDLCASLAESVTRMGHQVVGQAYDTHQTLELLRLKNPSIVFLDVAAPGMDCIEILAQINGLKTRTHAIMMSADVGDADTLRQCLRLGATDIVAKPLQSDRIADCIKRVPEPCSERVNELGKLCCVGYTPSFQERRTMASARLGYLLYPTCHLAMRFFARETRLKSGMVVLTVHNGLAMYGARQANPDFVTRSKGMEPWQQVVTKAQQCYETFWGPALSSQLLPRTIPILTVSPKEPTPKFMDPSEILSLVAQSQDDGEKKSAKAEEHAAEQVSEQETVGSPGEAVDWSRMADKLCRILDKVQDKHPQLFSQPTAREAEMEAMKRNVKIDTRPVKIVPDHLRGDGTSRMARSQRGN